MARFWRKFADRADVRVDPDRRENALAMACEWEAVKMSSDLHPAPVEELVLDYDFDGLPYTYCPGTDDVCHDDSCIVVKQCRKEVA